MKKRLRSIIEDNTTKESRLFNHFIQFLIFINLVCFSIETIPDNSKLVISILSYIEITSIVLFSIEYLLRIYVSKKPLKYIFSFYGLIDLLAIIPFYFISSIDLRTVKIFRVFSLFKSLKLIRYSNALRRFGIATKLVKEEMVLFLFAVVILIYISAVGIYHFENKAQPEVFSSMFNSLWWAVVSITTVGYGDSYPITIGGKVFTFLVLIIGIAVVTIPAGLVASALTKARDIEDKKKEEKDNE